MGRASARRQIVFIFAITFMDCADDIYKLAAAGVRHLVPYKPGKPIEELQRELGLERVIKLASNENPLGPSPKALQAIRAALPDLALYPDGSGFRLKSALAEKHALGPEQITLGNGSNEILELAARAFLTPDHEAVFSRHAFAVYPIVTQAAGAKAKIAPARGYGHDLEAMLSLVSDKTRLIFIANPNNPTGTLLAAADLKAFLNRLPPTAVCVLDEAYFEFVAARDPADSVAWLKAHANLIITRTFSKAYGLAGLRVGYALSSPAIADLLNRVRQPFNNNALALAAAEAALSDTEHLRKTVANNQAGMRQLTEGFEDMGLAFVGSSANFILVELNRPGTPVFQALLKKGVIVRPVDNYELPRHLRVSVGVENENRLFLQALRSVLADV